MTLNVGPSVLDYYIVWTYYVLELLIVDCQHGE